MLTVARIEDEFQQFKKFACSDIQVSEILDDLSKLREMLFVCECHDVLIDITMEDDNDTEFMPHIKENIYKNLYAFFQNQLSMFDTEILDYNGVVLAWLDHNGLT